MNEGKVDGGECYRARTRCKLLICEGNLSLARSECSLYGPINIIFFVVALFSLLHCGVAEKEYREEMVCRDAKGFGVDGGGGNGWWLRVIFYKDTDWLAKWLPYRYARSAGVHTTMVPETRRRKDHNSSPYRPLRPLLSYI